MVLSSSMGCMSKVSRNKCLIGDSEVVGEETGAMTQRLIESLFNSMGFSLERVRKRRAEGKT